MRGSANATWVMNFLKSIESNGNHAPTETMARVTENEQRLFDALNGLLSYTGGWDITDESHPIRIAIRAKELAEAAGMTDSQGES